MTALSIHQAVHGYRDGHRLLASSVALSADAARAMLVLSDMSGPSMQPGFDQYLTSYPLPGSDFFVFAKTWYAPEMHRPGCVWTHSLLIPRVLVSGVTSTGLTEMFRRPQADLSEKSFAPPLLLGSEAAPRTSDRPLGDRAVTAALLGALLGQPRPVIVVAESASQFETAILALWEGLWPAERARFSFCTGALMPRSIGGGLLDVQAVPRSLPTSQYRKSAAEAVVLDLRSLPDQSGWVDLVLGDVTAGDGAFGAWLQSVAGSGAGRTNVPSLAPIFGEWRAAGASANSFFAAVINAEGLEEETRERLVGMAFARAESEGGVGQRQELLLSACRYLDRDLAEFGPVLEEQTRRLFDISRAEGVSLLSALLHVAPTAVGERVLRAAVDLLEPCDIEAFGEAETPLLPALVVTKPQLATSPELWRRIGSRGREVLARLELSDLHEETRRAVVDAILLAGRDVPVSALVRFGGKGTVLRGLAAVQAGQIQLSWPWRSEFAAQPDLVLEWIESLPSVALGDLELGSRFLTPKTKHARLVKVWTSGTSGTGALAPRVAAFGLALAYREGSAASPLLASCFQPTYDAAGVSRLEYEEWEWLREHAPAVSWYREWDRCERLAAAVARLFEREGATLETVFGVVQTGAAVKKVIAILDDDRTTRRYLKSLRKFAAELDFVGNGEQRDALLDGR